VEAGTPGVTRPIDVIIADDHAVVRDGIRAVLLREGGEFRVVAEAADIPATIREVRVHKPDLLTLDLTMPGGSSLAALPQCFVAHPPLAVAIRRCARILSMPARRCGRARAATCSRRPSPRSCCRPSAWPSPAATTCTRAWVR
jgi:hypothetical protein